MEHASPVVRTPLGQWHTFCLHSRSCMLEGASDSYSCEEHVACVAQVRSVVRVGAAFSYSPLVHTSAGVQGRASSAPEKLVPDTHAAQVRSTVAEGVLVAPCPGGHVDHATAVTWPAEAVKVPAAFSAHTRFCVVCST